MAAAVQQWLALPSKGSARAAFARKFGLTADTLCMLCDMRQQFAAMLADMGMLAKSTCMNGLDDPTASCNRHADKAFVVRHVLRQTLGDLVCALCSPNSKQVIGHTSLSRQVKAALCAALQPNVAVMESSGQTSRPGWMDHSTAVALHPQSVLHPLTAGQLQQPFLVYLEKVVAWMTIIVLTRH